MGQRVDIPRRRSPFLLLAGALAALLMWALEPTTGAADEPKETPKKEAKTEQPAEKGPLPRDFEKLLKKLKGLDPEQMQKMRAALEKAQKDMDRAREEMRKATEQYRAEMRKALDQAAKQARQQASEGGRGRGRFGARDGVRLGILPLPPSPTLADQLGLPEGKGIVVAKVLPESPAAKAGLKEHDILLEFNGKAVPSNPDELKEMLADIKSDKSLDVIVIRKGKRQSIKGLKLLEGKHERREPPRRPPTKQTDTSFGERQGALVVRAAVAWTFAVAPALARVGLRL